MKTLLLGMAAVLTVFAPLCAQAAVWTGAGDSDWANSANWDTGAVPSDIAIFTGISTANQPDLGSTSRSIGTLDFQSAGWTVSGSLGASLTFTTVSAITSAGTGVNTVDLTWGDSYVTDMNISAAIGNTLVLTKDFTQRRSYALSGDGMIVIEGNSSSGQTWALGAKTMLFNCANKHNVSRNSVVSAGSMLGGIVPEFEIAKYSSLTLEDGASLSPGGDGVYGQMIHSLRVSSDSDTVRAYLDMGGSNSSLIMDLGTSAGENDELVVDLAASNGYFYLRDCELALRGAATLADGDYILVTEESGNYNGTFGSITYNGVAADPSNFALTYNEDSIVLTVSGVPEPASMALLATGALVLIRRKRN